MNENWPKVKLGDILTYSDERIQLDDLREYITITIKRRHGGLEVREKLFGNEIITKKQFKLIPGAFIISRVQCWHQAYAIVPDDIPENMIASTNYDQYRISSDIESKFFWWLSHSPEFTETVRSSASGVVIEKMVFNRDSWLNKTITIPPLDEQRRIVAHIEALSARIAEARSLRQQAVEEAKALLESYTDQVLMELASRFGSRKFSEICTTITDGDHITPQFSTEGVKFIFVGNVSSGRLHFNSCKYVTEEYFAKIRPQRIPQRGDILYSAVGATLGVPALVDVDEPFCFQRHIAILKPDHSRLDSRFAWHMLQSGKVYQKAWSSTTGSAQPTIPLKAIRELEIPVPPIQEQQRIVTHLDDLHTRVDALKRLQTETAAELDALLPAVLDRAFRGELV